ncbi:MAG: alpha-amylase [Promethearchaeota archaeon CR_4]|nr:MAG: alpha-amylase [Candidatus Lokiarchaeota archaeon CR_4]
MWSPDKGYPGDKWYQEFHQKDAQSGLHYWRVTGAAEKAIYNPQKAVEQLKAHADHFTALLSSELATMAPSVTEQGPIIVSPYDWELFGHWWHEGVDWIDAVYRKLSSNSGEKIMCATLSEYMDANQDSFSTIKMKPSTWGLNGDFTVWQNKEHGWIWPYVNASCRDFEQILAGLTKTSYTTDQKGKRVLRQLGRELLLMEGSDWPFLLYTKQAKEYSNQRFHNHHQRFQKLAWAAKNLAESARVNEKDLREMEDLDSPWPDLDFTLFK